MGCTYCLSYEYSNEPVELVYGDNKLLIEQRPRTINDLVEKVLNFEKHFEKPSDFTLEYITYEGVKPICHEVSLQQAYQSFENTKVIIGIRPSFEHSSRLSTVETANF